MTGLSITRLNSVPAAYQAVMALQQAIYEQRKLNLVENTVILLQHSPVYTVGKRGRVEDFPAGTGDILASGAEIAAAPRGGETTYHGPGQLVAYPIVSLRALKLGARAYVEALEDIMIATAGRYGVTARGRLSGRTGVWVGERKLGAVGVAISGGVTRHGLAFNVCTDLAAFSRIVPCGDRDREATSLQLELGAVEAPTLAAAAAVLAEEAASRLGGGSVRWIPDVNELLTSLHEREAELAALKNEI